MANQRQIKSRVTSINNIDRITSALEIVAASKVQKAEEKAINMKPYAEKVYELVSAFKAETDLAIDHPLLRQPDQIKNELLIIVSTNRGLVGGLNTQLLSFLRKKITESKSERRIFITLGTKGIPFSASHGTLLADFSKSVNPENDIPALVNLIVEEFSNEKVDSVSLLYNDYRNVLEYVPTMLKLFPITSNTPKETVESTIKFNFEPSPGEVLKNLLTFYIGTEIRAALYEAEASEHAARMVAMKNASDNAKELSQALSLEYNKVRQQAITTEIADVVSSSQSAQS